jgi:hypothetical protein
MYKSVLGEEENTKFPLGVCHLHLVVLERCLRCKKEKDKNERHPNILYFFLNWAISLVVYIGNLGKHRLDENSVTYLEQVTI